MNRNTEEYEKAEKELVYWQYDKCGSFTTNLFRTISSADAGNLYRLSLGFPDHVEIYSRYANEPNYFESIKNRMGI